METRDKEAIFIFSAVTAAGLAVSASVPNESLAISLLPEPFARIADLTGGVKCNDMRTGSCAMGRASTESGSL